MSPDELFAAGIRYLVLLLAISAHESAHALSALRSGDATAAEAGRISLNPLRHVDVIGSLLVPAVLLATGGPLFGWGRPAPVRVAKLQRPDADHIRVTLAGPLANLAIGLLALVGLAMAIVALGPEAARSAGMALMGDVEGAALGPQFALVYTLLQFASINGFLAAFNMLPVPPLDGGQLALQMLPPPWAGRLAALRPYGFMIVLLLAAVNILSILVLPVYFVIALVIQISG